MGDGIYVWTNTSTQNKILVLSRLFTLYHMNPAELVFYLRDESETAEDAPESRQALRRRYWAFALPMIRERCGEGGPFSNVRSSRDNWINGYFGVIGCYLCCVANYDEVRVKLVFAKADKAANERTYDKVLACRVNLESVLGTVRSLFGMRVKTKPFLKFICSSPISVF